MLGNSLHFLVGIMRLIVFVVDMLSNCYWWILGWIALIAASREALHNNIIIWFEEEPVFPARRGTQQPHQNSLQKHNLNLEQAP
jgi:hypothetical protein